MENNGKVKLLLVDDDEDILEFMGYSFNKFGYDVYKAKNGIEAIEQAVNILPEIIILDIMMPEMDGFDTCKKLRKIKVLKHALIVFLSAKGDIDSQTKGFKIGADDYFKKPIKPNVILDRLLELQKNKMNNQIN
jgi:two-component system alkaline phosphatase synthesis response regulator PhoP